MPNYTSFEPLFRDMRETAQAHPDWTFVVADQPPVHLGWAAFPPTGRVSDPLRTWTIGQAYARRDASSLDPELQEAVRSPRGREQAISLILGRLEPEIPEQPDNVPFTSLGELFRDMKLVADHHPDWIFMGADDPTNDRIGWLAQPPEQSEGVKHWWTISLADVRMQAQKLDAHWQDAIRTTESRDTTLIEMVIGRPGNPKAPPPPAVTPSRYDILMKD